MAKQRLATVDLIRVGLIFIIFLCHTSKITPELVSRYASSFTQFALEIFFIISGFCTYISVCNKKLSATAYIKGKVKKLFPLHFLMFLACLLLQVLQLVSIGQPVPVWDYIKQTVVNLLFLQSWTPNEAYVYSFNGVTWFLSSIMFCYLLTPFVAPKIKKYSDRVWFMLAAIILLRYLYVAAFSYFIGQGGFCYTNVFPPYRFFEYSIGMVLGAAYVKASEKGIPTSSFCQLFGTALFVLIFVIDMFRGGVYNCERLYIVFECFFIYSVSFYNGILTKISSAKIVTVASGASFAFYLIHQPVIKTVYFLAQRNGIDVVSHKLPVWLICLSLTAGLSFLYYFIETKVNLKTRSRKV